MIFITFKDIKMGTWDKTFDMIKILIEEIYLHHDYLLESNALKESEKQTFDRILKKQASYGEYTNSLRKIIRHLRDYHGEKVIVMIDEYGQTNRLADIKRWYNGYIFGSTQIYNPWSILNYIKQNPDHPEPYWINTSSNDLVKQLITKSPFEAKESLELLLGGKSICKPVNDNIVYSEIDNDENALWSFLLMSGYLKHVGRNQKSETEALYNLQIPNLEVSTIYTHIVKSWFSENIENKKLMYMLKAMTRHLKQFSKSC